jgi:hypothetical protein
VLCRAEQRGSNHADPYKRSLHDKAATTADAEQRNIENRPQDVRHAENRTSKACLSVMPRNETHWRPPAESVRRLQYDHHDESAQENLQKHQGDGREQSRSTNVHSRMSVREQQVTKVGLCSHFAEFSSCFAIHCDPKQEEA